MISPHGGRLIHRVATPEVRAELLDRATSLPRLTLGSREISDLEMIADGALSPLEGFMNRADYESVRDHMHLASGLPWSIPITLSATADQAAQFTEGQEIALCGILTGIQKRRNKEQKPWAFMQLEDWHGATEILCFATRYEHLQKEIEEDKAVLVRGKAMPEEDGTFKLNVQEIIPLALARVNFPSLVSIKVRLTQNGADKAQALRELFNEKPGETSVRLKLERPRDFQMLMDVPTKIRPDKEFRAAIERICGPEALEVLAS